MQLKFLTWSEGIGNSFQARYVLWSILAKVVDVVQDPEIKLLEELLAYWRCLIVFKTAVPLRPTFVLETGVRPDQISSVKPSFPPVISLPEVPRSRTPRFLAQSEVWACCNVSLAEVSPEQVCIGASDPRCSH